MNYDLALGRLSHDMLFKMEYSSGTVPIQKASIWPINGADKVAQQIKITLLAFLGEWFLDNTFGVPYLEEILIKNPRLSSVESILRSKIMAVPDVERVPFFAMDFNRQERTLMVEYSAITLLGPVKDTVILSLFARRA